MNTCPVYRRSGGHSYHATVPGPIGSILNPLHDAAKHNSLPFACSLCGCCTDVCPVKIDLHHQLLAFRRVIRFRNLLPRSKQLGMKLGSTLLDRPRLFAFAGKVGRTVSALAPLGRLQPPQPVGQTARAAADAEEELSRDVAGAKERLVGVSALATSHALDLLTHYVALFGSFSLSSSAFSNTRFNHAPPPSDNRRYL